MEFLFTALIPVIAVIIIVITVKRIASHTFRCENCSAEFTISPSKAIVATHYGNEYNLVCPCCETKGWCVALPENNR